METRSKKLRKTCTIYVNHHEGKIMSVFKTVHLFVQGQGQRAPGDGWWCASFNSYDDCFRSSPSLHISTNMFTCLSTRSIFFFMIKKNYSFHAKNNDSIPLKALSCLHSTYNLYVQSFMRNSQFFTLSIYLSILLFMVCKYYMFIYC